MKAMADEKKSATGAGGKPVEPVQPRPGLAERLMKVPQFIAEVRQEAAKVTWPTISETRVTTIAVFVMVFMAIIFFAIVDFIISTGVTWLLG